MPSHKLNRVFFLLFLSILFATGIIVKLFHLQVIKHSLYAARAEEGHLGVSEVKPKRGEILIRDYQSKEVFRLATNTSFPLIFADPTLIKDPTYLADKLAPLLFDKEIAEAKNRARIRELKRLLPVASSKEELDALAPKTAEEMQKDFRAELFEKLSQKTRQSIVLYKSPAENMIKFLEKEHLPGIEITPEAITAYPPQIGDPEYAAKVLAPLIEIPYERVRELLNGRNRYSVLRQKVPPNVEGTIRKLIDEDKREKRNLFTGINFQEKDYRYYPEGSLAAQVVGFVSDHGGVYGIEQSFEAALRGKKGIFKTKLDATGNQVIVGDDLIIQPALDGETVTLTIDRSVQMQIEKLLARSVMDTKADSGFVIIMDPKTGRIITMAHYPTFDPNNFGKALETEDITLNDADKTNITTVGSPGEETHYLTIDPDSHYRIQIFQEKIKNLEIVYSKYKNLLGPGVYRNRAVADIFEPGSVFKTIAMSIALDDGDVTPQTTYNDTGPIKVDEYEIHNATNKYNGITTMKEVIERSLNTGIAFVTRKMGRELFYRYLKKYGFGERTDIEFEGEADGKLKDASHWAESELITYGFGQGIAVTPVQLITAIAAIANRGVLMKPHIVLQTESADGKVATYEPSAIRRVITEKAAATIGAIMVSAVENSVAKKAVVKGYRIAGKTGTAQTYKHGKPLEGPGTTIASFVGFAPFNDPKFAVLVTINRPRTTIWADGTAAPLFAQIGQFLFKYYNIPPEI